jgi:hypothetical protein
MRYKTMRGKTIDVARVFADNEHAVAIGNAGMNARGDLVDRSGNVIKSREEVAAEYHSHLPKNPRTSPNRDLSSQVIKTPAEIFADLDAAASAETKKSPRKRKIIDSED